MPDNMQQVRALPLLLFVVGALAVGQALWWGIFETGKHLQAAVSLAIGVIVSAAAIVSLRAGNDEGMS